MTKPNQGRGPMSEQNQRGASTQAGQQQQSRDGNMKNDGHIKGAGGSAVKDTSGGKHQGGNRGGQK